MDATDAIDNMRFDAIGSIFADIEASVAFDRMVGVDVPDHDPDQGHHDAEIGPGMRSMLDTHEVAATLDDEARATSASSSLR